MFTLSPDGCERERGFGTLTHVKNNLRTRMFYDALNLINAGMTVGLEDCF